VLEEIETALSRVDIPMSGARRISVLNIFASIMTLLAALIAMWATLR
jgi:hypothetical protein